MRVEATEPQDMALSTGSGGRVLILEAPYYREVCDLIVAGAIEVLDAHKISHDRIAVPGALELPQAFASAVRAGLFGRGSEAAIYRGVIVAGCVIRGETSHYDIVCNNANHWLMESAIRECIPLGNALLTVDTEAQALARASGGTKGKGGDAARACLRLMWLGEQFEKKRV